MKNNKPLFLEIWDFLKVRKAWWLVPLALSLILSGILIVLVKGSFTSVFVYMFI